MKILIIGAGSIGLLFGSKLALAGFNITAFVSERSYEYFRTQPLRITDLTGKKIEINTLKFLNPNDISIFISTENFPDICIISVKAYALASVTNEYRPILEKAPVIILLENGIGNEDVILNQLPSKSIFRLITSNGALRDSQGNIRHTGQGTTILSRINSDISSDSQIQTIIQSFLFALEQAGFSPEESDNPLEAIWKKGFINIGINAFGALTQLENGRLLEISGMDNLIRDTVEEAIAVAKAKQIPLDPKIDYVAAVFDVIQKTAKNRNSMLQDIENGRPTEISYLNGKIVEYGLQLGIPTPHNTLLTSLIKGLEFSKRKIN